MPRLILILPGGGFFRQTTLTTQWKSMEANLLKSCIWFNIFPAVQYKVKSAWLFVWEYVVAGCEDYYENCITIVQTLTPPRYESLPRLIINDGRGLFAKSCRISVLPVKTLSLRNWESLDRYSKGRLTDPLPLAGLLLKTKGLFCCFLLMASLFWGSSDGGSL